MFTSTSKKTAEWAATSRLSIAKSSCVRAAMSTPRECIAKKPPGIIRQRIMKKSVGRKTHEAEEAAETSAHSLLLLPLTSFLGVKPAIIRPNVFMAEPISRNEPVSGAALGRHPYAIGLVRRRL